MHACRFRELLLEFSANEDHSETLLEVLDPMIMKPSFSAESFSRHPSVGVAASQLSMWVQGVVKLHSTLQTKIRPLLLKVTNMKASLKEYSDKLKKEENKVCAVIIKPVLPNKKCHSNKSSSDVIRVDITARLCVY